MAKKGYKAKAKAAAKVAINQDVVNHAIKNYNDTTCMGAVLFKDSNINEITAKSGPLATANEYQVHYWFLNGRFTFEDNSVIDIAIPTVYFNYEQTVSPADVNFDLRKVTEMSEALEPIHNSKVNELLASEFATHLPTVFEGAEFEWKGINLGTIHRHPAGVRKFSGTDLCTKADDPGICFPLDEIENSYFKPSFSSILLHEGGKTVVCHSEYRLACNQEDVVSYFKGRTATTVHGTVSTPSVVESMIGIKPVDSSYTLRDAMPENDLMERINQLFHELDFSASTQFIVPDNVTKAVTTTSYYNQYSGYNASTNKGLPGNYTEEYKKVALAIEERKGYKLMQRWEIAKKQNMDIAKQLLEVENLFYETELTIPSTYTNKTVGEIIEIQEDMWLAMEEELEDEEKAAGAAGPAAKDDKDVKQLLLKKDTGISKQAKINALTTWGFSNSELQTYSEDEVDEMYGIMLDNTQ